MSNSPINSNNVLNPFSLAPEQHKEKDVKPEKKPVGKEELAAPPKQEKKDDGKLKLDRNTEAYKEFRQKMARMGEHYQRHHSYYTDDLMTLYNFKANPKVGIGHKIRTKIFRQDLAPLRNAPENIRTMQQFNELKERGSKAADDHIKELALLYLDEMEFRGIDIEPGLKAKYWMGIEHSYHYGLEPKQFEERMFHAFKNIRSEPVGQQIIQAVKDKENNDYDSDIDDDEYDDESDFEDSVSDQSPEPSPLPPTSTSTTSGGETSGSISDPLEKNQKKKPQQTPEFKSTTILRPGEDDDDDDVILDMNSPLYSDPSVSTTLRTLDGLPVDTNGNLLTPHDGEPTTDPFGDIDNSTLNTPETDPMGLEGTN